MKVEGTHALPAARELVWAMLMDPEVMTRCLPGCEKLELQKDNSYRASLKIGLSSVKGKYEGTLCIEDPNPPESYKLVVEGKGSPGFVRATASINLADHGIVTDLQYSGESVVGGPIASIGQRMLQGVANTLIRHFFESFERELRAGTDGADPDAH